MTSLETTWTVQRTAWRALPSFARGLLAGALTGAALGFATVLLMMAEAGGTAPDQVLQAVVVLGAFAAVIGGAVGSVSALTGTVLALLAHAVVRPLGTAGARLVGAAGAALPGLVLVPDSAVWGGALMAASAACAALWMRWVVGLPRASATMGP